MSLDLYVGSLARYYLRDFQTPQQELAKQNSLHHAFAIEPKKLTAVETKSKLNEFKYRVYELTAEHCPDICKWNDKEEKYQTEQLHYTCSECLYIIARSMYHPEIKRPKLLSEDNENYPNFPELSKEEYFDGLVGVLNCSMFLPGDCNLMFETKDLLNHEITITSLDLLEQLLEKMTLQVWNSTAEPKKWLYRGPVINPEDIEELGVGDVVLFNAEYAFAVWFMALKFAKEHNVPIVLDLQHKAEVLSS